MRVEMQRRQDLPPLSFVVHTLNDERSPMYFPSNNVEQDHNRPSTHGQNHSVIDLTMKNPQYKSTSYQTPPPSQRITLKYHVSLKMPITKSLHPK